MECLDCGGGTPKGNHKRCVPCATLHRSNVSLKTWEDKKAVARGDAKPVKRVNKKWLSRGLPSSNSGMSQISNQGA